jgi:alkylation response protein AidB-like acyl-CoA dehydrogenase
VHGGQQGLNMVQNAHFVALEGTRTFACQFRKVFVPDAEVLAHPAEFGDFVRRIKPGFVTMQCGIALGIIDDCVAIMRESDETHAHVNRYLDDQAEDLAAELATARTAILDLAARISAAQPVTPKEILSLRAAGSELSLKASNAAMLHSGAKGYLIRNPAQRRVREAIFVAIVTPALKHLRKELAAIDKAAA